MTGERKRNAIIIKYATQACIWKQNFYHGRSFSSIPSHNKQIEFYSPIFSYVSFGFSRCKNVFKKLKVTEGIKTAYIDDLLPLAQFRAVAHFISNFPHLHIP